MFVDTDANEEKKWAGEGEGLGEEESFSEKLPAVEQKAQHTSEYVSIRQHTSARPPHTPAVEQKADHDSFIGRFLYLFCQPARSYLLVCVCARAIL